MLLRKLAVINMVLFLSVATCTSVVGQAFVADDIIRINGSQPVISQQMFADLGVSSEGSNINGPSLIRVPDWIAPEDRADPSANYYLYFGHHSGDYIRMAWASDISGPWHLYDTGTNVMLGDRGVLDNGDMDIDVGMGIVIEENHLASPDVHVDNDNQRIIMYFHSGSSTFFHDTEMNGQFSWVTTSPFGLEFAGNIEPVRLSTSYFRVFAHGGELYAFDNSQYPRRALDAENPWEPTPDYYDGDTISNLWDRHPEEFTQDPIFAYTGLEREDLRVRHTAVRVVGDELQVFYTQRGDSPERVMMSTVDLSVGDWSNWVFSYPGEELLQAVSGWEGGQFIPEPSEASAAPENANQLRDPFVFEDEDGSLYLLYAGRGEDALGMAAMSSPNQEILAFQPTDDSYVRSGNSSNLNFGSAAEMEVRQSSNLVFFRRTLVKFDLSSVDQVDAAVVRMFANVSGSTTVTVSEVSNIWSEGTVNANNVPPQGAAIATIEMGPGQQWYEWDVTEYVRNHAGDDISFIFTDESQGSETIEFSSREGTATPQLKILIDAPDFVLGDVNQDGVVNLLDVSGFVDLLSNGQFQLEGDINGDGAVNLLDVNSFIDLISG